MPVTLKSLDLLSKYGFDDGSALDEALGEAGYDALADALDDPCSEKVGFGMAVLEECVRRHLEPRLYGFEIAYGLSLSHNPVRFALWDRIDTPLLRERLEGVVAHLDDAEILAVAAALAPGYGGARAAFRKP